MLQKINSKPPATTKMNNIDGWTDGRRKYKQMTSIDGCIRKYKRTDGQTDETMTATNAIGEFY